MRREAAGEPGRICTGQAAIEAAFTIPALVLVAIFTAGVCLLSTARAEVSAAASMAVLGAASAPAHRGDLGMRYADEAWIGTLRHDGLLIPVPLASSCAGTAPGGGYAPGDQVTCTGTARLALSRTIVAAIWPFGDPSVSVTVTTTTSPYRAGCLPTTCGG